ncbi:hypothetical protein [Neomoorella thermoacetica]|uniref:hypothetical protein n=1 Tax=Neomoorella thermoacetica TaxID=1525 RepID=UPI0008FBB736|nr:hypothetical protein [Moorella thermoacetica]APC09061.1 hypothetical protein MTJW_19110 [Moorella thermoacetica]OIQ54992.1 hypothetical protein MORE_07380 [Moorella thermoacetica]
MGNGNAANNPELDKMRAKILAIGQKYEQVRVRRTKSGPMEPFALKQMFLTREMFGGIQDFVLEFIGWLNQNKYCYKQTVIEFFTLNGLAKNDAEIILDFMVETGFLIYYIVGNKEIIGMDLGADAVIRNMGMKSNFSINTIKEIEKMAALAVVIPPRK